MFKINASTRLKATQQAPTLPGRTTAVGDTSGEELVTADSDIIAPATDFKKSNERELERQQNTRESEEDKEARSPTDDMSKTEVSDMDTNAVARLTATRRKG